MIVCDYENKSKSDSLLSVFIWIYFRISSVCKLSTESVPLTPSCNSGFLATGGFCLTAGFGFCSKGVSVTLINFDLGAGFGFCAS